MNILRGRLSFLRLAPGGFCFLSHHGPFAPIRGAWSRPARNFQDLRANSMTKNKRTKAAIPHQVTRILSCPAWFSSPRRTAANNDGRRREYGEFVMEVRVQLKICEGCGCLWYRAQSQETVYCRECEVKLKDFPSPESRKRRGRPGRKPHLRGWSTIAATGSL